MCRYKRKTILLGCLSLCLFSARAIRRGICRDIDGFGESYNFLLMRYFKGVVPA